MIIPSGYGQVNYRFTGTPLPNPAEVTLGFENNASGGVGDIAELFFDLWVDNGMDNFYTSSVFLTNTHVKLGPASTGPSADFGSNSPGVLNGDAMPANVATLLSKQTSDGGRAGRGRMYIMAPAEDSIDGDSRWDATQLAARQTDANAFLAACATADVPLVVLHGAGSPITTPSPILTLQVQGLLATQRRRLRR